MKIDFSYFTGNGYLPVVECILWNWLPAGRGMHLMELDTCRQWNASYGMGYLLVGECMLWNGLPVGRGMYIRELMPCWQGNVCNRIDTNLILFIFSSSHILYVRDRIFLDLSRPAVNVDPDVKHFARSRCLWSFISPSAQKTQHSELHVRHLICVVVSHMQGTCSTSSTL